jgi:hypothetical protein
MTAIQHQAVQTSHFFVLVWGDHFNLALRLETEGRENRFAVFNVVIDFVLEGSAESSHMS